MADGVDARFNSALVNIREVTKLRGSVSKETKQLVLSSINDLNTIYNELKKEVRMLKQKVSVVECKQVYKPTFAEITACKDKEKEIVSTFKTIIEPNKTMTSEQTKQIIKENIDPVNLGLSIRHLKKIKDGKVLIESSNKQDMEKITKEINSKCKNDLKAYIGNKKWPRMIVYNLPEEVTLENASEIIGKQNTEIVTNKNDIIPKKIFLNKRRNIRNLILEVNPSLRKYFLFHGIKVMWNLCRAMDYVSIFRCFHCNSLTRHNEECKNRLACPVCADEHRIQDCPRIKEQCNNCLNYNKNCKSDKKHDTNHSSLSRNCPVYLMIVNRVKQNIDYGN